MYIKIVRPNGTIFQECTKFTMTPFEHPEECEQDGNGNFPECYLEIYTIKKVDGFEVAVRTDYETLYKSNVLYVENNDGQTIEQYRW